MSANEWDSPVVPDRFVIVYIDGIRADWADTMLARLDYSLITRGAAFFPNFRTGKDGLTDPRGGAMITGYHEDLGGCCCNLSGNPIDHPGIGKLLPDSTDALFVTAKRHLAETVDGNGMTVWVDLGSSEGPDSLAWHVFRDSMALYHPHFAVLNLAAFDMRAHIWSISNYYGALSQKANEATDCILALYDWLAADTVYAGKTLLAVTTDHGRHSDDWPMLRPWASHGHYPCGAELCAGCDDIWLYLCAPGTAGWLRTGTFERAYTHESLALTAKLIFGLPMVGERIPITEWIEETP